jgi:hypothetical protein
MFFADVFDDFAPSKPRFFRVSRFFFSLVFAVNVF